jgi:uncharacterized membrane protein
MKLIDVLKNKAVWVGLFGGVVALSAFLGKPALGVIFSDPTLADKVTLLVGTVTSIFAAFMQAPADAAK